MFDIKSLKKIRSENGRSVLRHPDGHEIHVNHSKLDHKSLADLNRMTLHLDEGGEVPQQGQIREPSSQQAPVVVNVQQAPPPQQQYDQLKQDYINTQSQPDLLTMARAGVPDATNQVPQHIQQQADLYAGNTQVARQAEEQSKVQAKAQQDAQIQQQINANKAKLGLPADQSQLPQAPSAPQEQETPRAPTDTYGTQAYYDNYAKGLGEEKAGLSQEAQALGQQGKSESEALDQGAQKLQSTIDTYQKTYQGLDQERQALMSDIQNQHIDPDRYLNQMKDGGKLKTAIGLMFGALGSGATGGENMAVRIIQQHINNDIDAQKAELGKKENLLTRNLQQFGNLRDATDMTRVMQNDIVSYQLKKAAAEAMNPLAKARYLQAAGKLDREAAPVLSQIAMRKSLMQGMQNGSTNPAMAVRMLVPQDQQKEAFKELDEAQKYYKTRDNTLKGFDEIAKLNTVGNRVLSPIQSKARIDAIISSIVPGLSKETAGRFTEQDASYIEKLLRSNVTASPETIKKNRALLNNFLAERGHFNMLSSYGISPQGLYGSGGEKRIKESAPVIK